MIGLLRQSKHPLITFHVDLEKVLKSSTGELRQAVVTSSRLVVTHSQQAAQQSHPMRLGALGFIFLQLSARLPLFAYPAVRLIHREQISHLTTNRSIYQFVDSSKHSYFSALTIMTLRFLTELNEQAIHFLEKLLDLSLLQDL